METELLGNEVVKAEDSDSIIMINQGYVTFPVHYDDFTEFISKLLGKPQEIQGRIIGAFDIELHHLRGIYHMLEQRIKQQNKADLIEFSTKIVFNDDTSVIINGIDELLTYNEIRPVVSTEVHMNWVYIVQFQDKKGPEKQEIQLSIITNNQKRERIIFNNRAIEINSIGYFEYSIKHTARTWGVDIQSLLNNHIKILVENKSTFKGFLKKNSGKISILLILFVFLSVVWGCIKTAQKFANQTNNDVSSFLKNAKLTTNDRIDYLARYIADGQWLQFDFKMIVAVVIGFVLSIVLSIWFGMYLDSILHELSFVSLTNESIKHKNKILKKSKKQWATLSLSVVISILCGVIANYIFQYLTIR